MAAVARRGCSLGLIGRRPRRAAGPDPDLLKALRQQPVLDDRDELQHFFTVVLGGRVFFEVVQQIGGYVCARRAGGPVRSPHRRGSSRRR
ncbi:hypothetical protein ILP97_13085 [Amycolatopsis sp. H6(2020)]|nr:hypothetical protein [Amycolatopsis sp. H6(2020)]